MVSRAEKVKLGTFLRNKLSSDLRYRDLALELGINPSIDPEYLLGYLQDSLGHDSLCDHEFIEVMKTARTSPTVWGIATEYMREMGYAIGDGALA